MRKRADYKVLNTDFINTPYIYDSSEVVLSKDTVLCTQPVSYGSFRDDSAVI